MLLQKKTDLRLVVKELGIFEADSCREEVAERMKKFTELVKE